MKEQSRDKDVAVAILKYKENNWSVFYAIKTMKMRILFYCILMILCLLLFINTPYLFLERWFLLLIGMGIGAFLRDIGWLVQIKKRSAFTEKITDWDKVKEIAEIVP